MDYVSASCCSLAFLLYYNTLDAGFVYDDRRAILSNPDLLSKTPWTRILENDFWGTPLSDSGSHGSYRPLCVLTFRLNYLLGGFQPWGYHLVNVLLHCLATGLLIRLAKVILPRSKSKVGATVTGLVFATHPIHTETVAGVVGRADLAACNFYFLSLLAYIAHVKYRDTLCCPLYRKKHVAPRADTKRYHRFVFSLQKNVTSCNWPKRHLRDFDHAEREVATMSIVMKTAGKGQETSCLCCWKNNLKLWIHFALCLLLAVAAMLSKETGITVLGICFVYDMVYSSSSHKKQARSLLILASALSVILAIRLQTRKPHFSTADNPTARETDFLTRLLTFSYLPVFNFWLLIFPNTLSFDWGMEAIPRITTVRDSRNLVTIAFYLGLAQMVRRCIGNLLRQEKGKVRETHLCAVCVSSCFEVHSPSCRTTNNNNSTSLHSCVCHPISSSSSKPERRTLSLSGALLLSLSFLALPFLPATNILFYVGFVVAERVLYLPSAGLCLLLGLAAAWLWEKYKRFRLVFLFCLVLVVVAFSAKTVFRNRDWRDEEALYRSAIAVNPPKAYGNLGSVLSSQGRIAEAELAFREALHYRPNMADVHYNLDFWRRPLTLNELLEEAENLDIDDGVIPNETIIFPPDNNDITNEDSGDECNVDISNLPGGRLRADAEVNFDNTDSDSILYDSDDDLPLSRYGHCCDNANLAAGDRFAKLRPLISLLNEKFMDMAPPAEHHSVDESMVPYYGRHPTKQFIRGKPTRWEYKLWTGTNRLGYIEWFEPYQGSNTKLSEEYKALGLGASVVLEFVDALKASGTNMNYHILFDNLFNSLPLLSELKSRGIKGTGTNEKIVYRRVGK